MLAQRELRGFASSIATVTIGVLMLTFALALGDSVRQGMESSARAIIGDADAVVSGNARENALISDAVVSEIKALENDVQVRTISEAVGHFSGVKSGSIVFVNNLPQLSESTTLVAGRLPDKEREVAISQSVAKAKSYSVGSTIELLDSNWQPAGEFSVVGIIAPGADTTVNTEKPAIYALDTDIAQINGAPGHSTLYVSSEQPDIRERISALPAARNGEISVFSAQSEITRIIRSSTVAADLIIAVMAALGIMCVVVSSIVVTSVFHTFATRRRREFALLRCIGASKSTVFSIVMREGLAVGVAGSILGIALGGIATKFFATTQSEFLGSSLAFSISPRSVVIAFLVGVSSTLIASLRPARVANSVPPALMANKHAIATASRAASITKAITAVALLLAGGALLTWAADSRSLLLAIPGGLVTAFAVILGMQPLIVVAGAALNLLADASGSTTFSIAVGNMLRNVRRSANSALALAVGATLTGLATVGLASVSATTLDFSDRETPIDAVILGDISEETVAAFAAIDGVESARAIPSTSAVIHAPDGQEHPTKIIGIDAADRELMRMDTAGTLDANTLVVGNIFKIPDGSTVDVQQGARRVEMAAHSSEPRVAGAVVSREGLAQLTEDPKTETLWLRFDGRGVDRGTKDRVIQMVAEQGLEIQGQVAPRLAAHELMRTYSIIVFSIIFFALVVALIGVATATELSVFERRDEIRLFRCLGTTKRMVVASFAVEALCIAGTGSVIGLVFGAVLGGVGASTVLSTADAAAVLDFNVWQLLLVLGGCVGFGVLSAALASYRAVRG